MYKNFLNYPKPNNLPITGQYQKHIHLKTNPHFLQFFFFQKFFLFKIFFPNHVTPSIHFFQYLLPILNILQFRQNHLHIFLHLVFNNSFIIIISISDICQIPNFFHKQIQPLCINLCLIIQSRT